MHSVRKTPGTDSPREWCVCGCLALNAPSLHVPDESLSKPTLLLTPVGQNSQKKAKSTLYLLHTLPSRSAISFVHRVIVKQDAKRFRNGLRQSFCATNQFNLKLFLLNA